MSATVYQHEEERLAVGVAPLIRTADFEELFRELVEEAGRALEEGDLGWWALLQEVLIPNIDAEIQSVRSIAGYDDAVRSNCTVNRYSY